MNQCDILWVPAIEEVDRACSLFNENLFKGLSRKLMQASQEMLIDFGQVYYSQALYRYSSVHKLPCFKSKQVMKKGLLEVPLFLKIGRFQLRLNKIDPSMGHVSYVLEKTT